MVDRYRLVHLPPRRAIACCCLLFALAAGPAAYAGGDAGEAEEQFPWQPGEGAGEPETRLDLLSDDWSQFTFTNRFIFHRLFNPASHPAAYWTLGSLLVGSAVLAHNKSGVQAELLENDNEERREIAAGAKVLGDTATVPALGLVLFLQGLAFRQPRVHRTGVMILESALYTSVFTGIGQFVFSEERPENGGDLEFFQRKGHGISGHASIAASIAAPISRGLFRVDPDDGRWKRFGKRVGTGIAYGAPALTGLSRIEHNKHYAWNVLLGLSIGYATGDAVADAHDARREERWSRWAPSAVGPLVTEDGSGIQLDWRF
jgi:hypothetical protein